MMRLTVLRLALFLTLWSEGSEAFRIKKRSKASSVETPTPRKEGIGPASLVESHSNAAADPDADWAQESSRGDAKRLAKESSAPTRTAQKSETHPQLEAKLSLVQQIARSSVARLRQTKLSVPSVIVIGLLSFGFGGACIFIRVGRPYNRERALTLEKREREKDRERSLTLEKKGFPPVQVDQETEALLAMLRNSEFGTGSFNTAPQTASSVFPPNRDPVDDLPGEDEPDPEEVPEKQRKKKAESGSALRQLQNAMTHSLTAGSETPECSTFRLSTGTECTWSRTLIGPDGDDRKLIVADGDNFCGESRSDPATSDNASDNDSQKAASDSNGNWLPKSATVG